jgi:inorganic pyrophosphatase
MESKLPSPNRLEPGTNPPEEVNVTIEIPKDSNLKYEMDSKSGEMFVDRILSPAMYYPLNYGFIPQTRESSGIDGDSDPIDVFILGNYSSYPKSVIHCRPIGILLTEDQAGVDSKIIAAPLIRIDPTFSTVEDIDDVPEYLKQQLKHFIEHHKDLEEKKGKYVKIIGWEERDAAKLKITEAIKRYKE